MRYVIRGKVRAVEHRFAHHWVGGNGADAMFKEISIGWFVQIGDVGIFIGHDKPELSVGQLVRLVIEPESEHA